MDRKSYSSTDLSINSRENPFRVGRTTETLNFREIQKLQKMNSRLSMFKHSLAKRTDLLKPKIPPLTFNKLNVKRFSPSKSNSFSNGRSSNDKLERIKRMTEFVQTKREIYLTQMVIDQKTNEINKLYQEQKDQEDRLVESEAELVRTMTRQKKVLLDIEKKLAEARKAKEGAISNRIDLLKQLKKQRLLVQIAKSEKSKNEYTLELYRIYNDFLKMFRDDIKEDPQNLIDEIENNEKDNLFLAKECQRLSDLEGREHPTEVIIKGLSDSLDRVEEMLGRNKMQMPQEFSGSDHVDTLDTDNNIKYLESKIKKVYRNCFKADTNIAPIMMLEKLDNTLESFYKRLEQVKPSFVDEIQSKYDKERREQQRIAMQAEKERIQQEKKEQAILRANRPIKKKGGRPLVERCIPRKVTRIDDEEIARLLREQQKMEEFLYGPVLT